jgi:hypothetical protein
MSDFREMADVVFMWQHSKSNEDRPMTVNIPKGREKTHSFNAKAFYDSASMSFSVEPTDTRKPQLNPVFEMPYVGNPPAIVKESK